MKNRGHEMQPPHMRVMTIMTESNEWETARSTTMTVAHDWEADAFERRFGEPGLASGRWHPETGKNRGPASDMLLAAFLRLELKGS